MSNANQPGAMWAGRSDPFVLVSGHLVSPEDGFGEIGRMANGDLRRPNRLEVGTGGIHGQVQSVITRFGGIPMLDLRRANGTEAAPTAILTGETLGRLNFIGHDGVAFAEGPRIRCIAFQNWVPGAHGSGLDFFSIPDGSVVVTNRWRLLPAGHLVTAADNVLDIGATGANRPRSIFVATSLISPLVQVTGDGGMEWTGQTDGAGAGAGTLTNAPSAGDPAFWIPVEVNGTTHFIPAWT